MTGRQLRPSLADCDSCTLADCPVVLGYGPEQADIVLVGEAPGDEEVSRGRPFVGRSGELLDRALREAGIDRERCYVTNAVLCRPVPHRAPDAAELKACSARLIEEIRSRNPKLVIALGDKAAKALLPNERSISKIRGFLRPAESTNVGLPVMPTWHPAYVLRNPNAYPELVADLRNAVAQGLEGRTQPEPVIHVIRSVYDLCDVVIDHAPAVDVETDSEGNLLCVGVGFDDRVYVYSKEVLAHPLIRDDLERILRWGWIAHNAKFDAHALRRHGFDVWPLDDTMLMHHAADPRRGSNGLKTLAKSLFGAPDYDAGLRKYKDRMELVPEDELHRYNAYDVAYTYRLFNHYRRDAFSPFNPYRKILRPALPVVARMEEVGVLVDWDRLEQVGEELKAERDRLEHEAWRLAGTSFNPNSPKQLAEVLFDRLGLPDLDGRSTREEVLEALKDRHEIVGVILQYRKVQKLLSTYVDGLRRAAGPDGRVRTTFNLHGTETGRLSSSDPINLQNIPRPDTDGGRLRNLFIATPGYVLIEADYSQAELRVLAHECRDPNLVRAYETGEDIHIMTASKVFAVPPEQVTKQQRQIAKTLNFAILYGAEAPKIAQTAGISLQEADRAIRAWFEAYPMAAEWIKARHREVLETGQVRTSLGWVRRWPVITRENRSAVLREAVNTPIQSTAGLLTLIAITRIGERIDWERTRFLLTVHDSILLETQDDPVEVGKMVHDIMVSVPRTWGIDGVPFEAELKVGERWGSTKELALVGGT